MKKIVGLKMLCTTIAASSLLAAIPLFTTSCSSDTEWDIKKFVLNTEQIADWDFASHGTKSQLKTVDYVGPDPTTPYNEPTSEVMVSEIQNQLTTWFVINSLVELLSAHNRYLNGYESYLEVRGLHIRQSDHKIKIDYVQYKYGFGKEVNEMIASTIGYIPLLACRDIDSEVVNGNLLIGSSFENSWNTISNGQANGEIPYLSCPVNFWDLNGCQFPYVDLNPDNGD